MPTFILGAGFNADARQEAGPVFAESLYVGRHRVHCDYPLVGDLIRLCFGLDRAPDGMSIEDLFASAPETNEEDAPITKLADCLSKADYYIASRIAADENMNCYRKLFHAFAGSTFLTFNYDSLPETVLFRLGFWYPHDGYGVPVVTHLPPGQDNAAGKRSRSFVLHLHGSLCIRTSEFEARREPGQETALLQERDKPLYAFDPLSISANFAPFVRDVGEGDTGERIIAPVPDKSKGLKAAFIRETYTRALALVKSSGIVVAIGYSFNAHDSASYESLLTVLSQSNRKRLLIVSPQANAIARGIRSAFPSLSVEARDATLRQWVGASYPGL